MLLTCTWENSCSADMTLSCGSSVGNNQDPNGNDIDTGGCGGISNRADRIYAFTAPASGSVQASVTCADSGDDYQIYVYEGACHQNLCHDAYTFNACTSGSDLTFTVTAGLTYYIVVEPWFASDDFGIALNCL